MKHGRHWPREEQNANAFEGFGNLAGNDAEASRIKAAWASVLPPFDVGDDPYRPEYESTEGVRHG